MASTYHLHQEPKPITSISGRDVQAICAERTAAAATSMALTEFPRQLFAGCHFLNNRCAGPAKSGAENSLRVNEDTA
jgi:hypothetical protein